MRVARFERARQRGLSSPPLPLGLHARKLVRFLCQFDHSRIWWRREDSNLRRPQGSTRLQRAAIATLPRLRIGARGESRTHKQQALDLPDMPVLLHAQIDPSGGTRTHKPRGLRSRGRPIPVTLGRFSCGGRKRGRTAKTRRSTVFETVGLADYVQSFRGYM